MRANSVQKLVLEKQIIIVAGSISGSGLRYLPVEHNGNQNSSPEEAQALSTLVEDILEATSLGLIETVRNDHCAR